MYKLLQMTVICVLGLGGMLGYSKTQPANTFHVPISTNVPPSMLLAHVPTTLENAREPLKLDNKVKEAELAYTWYWIDKVFSRSSQWTKGIDRKEAECLSSVGKRGDDAVVVSWLTNGFEISVVDSRLLMLVIRKQGGIKDPTVDLFLKFCAPRRKLVKDPVSAELVGKEGDQVSWGKIYIKQNGWFYLPVEWYKTEDTIVFIFDKSLEYFIQKFEPNATDLFGGARIDDPTPYLRFEQSNRREHAEKQFRLLPEKLPVKRESNEPCCPPLKDAPPPKTQTYR